MASSVSILLRRASSPALLSKLSNPIRSASVAPSVSRFFNTNAQLTNYDDDDRSIAVDRGSDRSLSRRRDSAVSAPSFFSDVLDPFSPTRSLSQVLNLMDQMMENPFLGASRGSRRGWDVKESEDALFLRIDMPGLDKEDVKVSVEQNTLTVKGEAKDEEDEESGGRRRVSSRLDLPPNLYKLDSIRAEMKNGVLKLVVPKVKEEEKENVYEVKIE